MTVAVLTGEVLLITERHGYELADGYRQYSHGVVLV